MHADKNREGTSAEENVDPRSDTGKTVLHIIVVHLQRVGHDLANEQQQQS